ncbi:hypothetical protein HDU92_008925 [Lobulomyces angularis]|nr:hypothetical protein HDU92_008925 [Lobulomyces angularis]
MGFSLPPINQQQQVKMYDKSDKQIKARLNDHMQNISDAKNEEVKLATKLNQVNILKDSANYRTEREINLQNFRELLLIFQTAAKNGNGSITREQFKFHFTSLLGRDLNEEQMNHLFMNIAINSNDTIDWNDFSTFMLLRAEGQKRMREAAENQLFEIDPAILHRLPIQTPHKDQIGIILYLNKVKKYVTCGRDGTICYWSDKYKLQRCYKTLQYKRKMK